MNTLSSPRFLTAGLMALVLLAPSTGLAWFGLELDSGFAVSPDPFETAGDGGGTWEVSGRAMFSGSLGPVDAETHWLATALGSFGDRSILPPESNPFRSLDLEDVHYSGDRSALLSELDRLSLTLNAPDVRLTAGRQAVSWGEAYYYNIGDIFGAFPVTETSRLFKSGIDALVLELDMGPFSGLSVALAPSDEGDDSVAARTLFPVGPGSVTLTAGSILEAAILGAGCSADVKGTKVYATGLLSDPEEKERFTEFVVGAERQTGPYTRIVGELFYSSWGASDPDGYPELLLSDRYGRGMALALGRWNLVLEASRQVSALVTLTPAVFANISDGSALLRLDGAYSASDLTTLSGGLFLGLGDRPDGDVIESEFGGMPATLFLKVVHSL